MPSHAESNIKNTNWSSLRVASLARVPEGPVFDRLLEELQAWVGTQPPGPQYTGLKVDIQLGRDLLKVKPEDLDTCFKSLREHLARVRSRLEVDTAQIPSTVPTRAETLVEELAKVIPAAPVTAMMAKVVGPWHRREVVGRETMTFTPGSYVPPRERTYGSSNARHGNPCIYAAMLSHCQQAWGGSGAFLLC